MLTAIRYVASSESALLHGTPLHGAPLVRAIRVFYDLPVSEVRTRLEDALWDCRDGVALSDLAGLASRTIREEVLERLYTAEALERAFVGTEAVQRLRVG